MSDTRHFHHSAATGTDDTPRQPVRLADGTQQNGDRNFTTPEGTMVSSFTEGLGYQVGLYLVRVADVPQPAYNRPDDPPNVYTFEGAIDTPTGRVVETAQWVHITLDELLQIKQQELRSHVLFVREQSVRSTSSSNFWISLDQVNRDFYTSAVNFLTDRAKDRTIGEDSGADPIVVRDPATYWPRDVPVLLIRDSNGQRLIADVDEVAWGQVLKDWGLYDLATRDAAVNVENAFDTAYQAADWNALAAIDVTDPVYGWPTYYTGPQSLSVRRV